MAPIKMTADTAFDLLKIFHRRGAWVDCLAMAAVLRRWMTQTGSPRLRDWEKRLATVADIEASARRHVEESNGVPL